MYDAYHGIVPLSPGNAVGQPQNFDIVGPICESGDTFARNRAMPAVSAGGRVAILDVGAYGAVMSSAYNARPLAPIALVDGDRWTTIRARQRVEALWDAEIIPDDMR
jgi:diaminopimelate decarboxylase